MDSQNDENPSDVIFTLQSGFNELIRNAYLQGFNDGREFEQNIVHEKGIESGGGKDNNVNNESVRYAARSLQEAEQILSEY